MPSATRIPAGGVGCFVIPTGGAFDVISPQGPQVADMWAFAVDNPDEHLSTGHCRQHWGRIQPLAGDEIVSNLRRVMLVLVKDTSGGAHDTLLPACDAARYASLGYVGAHANCADNLQKALSAAVLPPLAPQPLNLFEHVALDDSKTLVIQSPLCPPGGSVRFEAVIACTVIISACPQDMVPTNGDDRTPKPIDVVQHAAVDYAVQAGGR